VRSLKSDEGCLSRSSLNPSHKCIVLYCIVLYCIVNHHMWVEAVAGSRPCSKGFSPRSSNFLPSWKDNISKFSLIWMNGGSASKLLSFLSL